MIATAMKIFLTLSTPCYVPERAVFYTGYYTTFWNITVLCADRQVMFQNV